MGETANLITAASTFIGAVAALITGIGSLVGARRIREKGDQVAAEEQRAKSLARIKLGYALLGAFAALAVAAVFFLARALANSGGDPGPTPSSTPVGTSSTVPTPPPALLKITYPPHDGEQGAPIHVSQRNGLIVRGTATSLGDDFLWLFDFDPTDGQLYEVSDAPIAVTNGAWEQHDGPIGDKGVKKVQYVVLVRANSACNETLKALVVQAKAKDAEPFSFPSPPVGCSEVDRAPVNIDLP